MRRISKNCKYYTKEWYVHFNAENGDCSLFDCTEMFEGACAF